MLKNEFQNTFFIDISVSFFAAFTALISFNQEIAASLTGKIA